ncbi:unnamed protein product [Mytilus coruscus]|uniref:Uncharacterized protein n=1 Tax=Mytilus coruscus TaxID=42192 RepID=A0A6J8A9T0_MYTCO|nr:unnamed protein product [Mytilus coruscus]
MSDVPDLTTELFELLTKIDSRLTVIEARTDRIENIETALSQLTRKIDTMKSEIIELKTNQYEELSGENSAQDNKIRQLQKDVLDIRDAENNITELKEKILELQSGYMRNTLAFTGLEESAEENTNNPIDIDIDINKCACEYGSLPSGEKIKKWDINKKKDFIINLDREKISELENNLEVTKSLPADSNTINKAVENITNIFVTSARKTFETLKNKSKNEKYPSEYKISRWKTLV